MPTQTVVSANESSVSIDGEPVPGVQRIDYRIRQARSNIYALGSPERIGVSSGSYDVEGRLAVASRSAKLDALAPAQSFQLIAALVHGEVKTTVTFDECYLAEQTFEMGVGGHGETVYYFTATRMERDR
jgi:hypothetical protein